MIVLGKTLRDVYNAMLAAYRVKDKKQGAKNALEIYTQNMALIEEARTVLSEIDDLVSVLQEGACAEVTQQRRP